MEFLVVGLNHRTAPLEVREKLSLSTDGLYAGLKAMESYDVPGAILSTCNRSEFYAMEPEETRGSPVAWGVGDQRIKQFLADYFDVPLVELERYLYVYRERDCIRHLFRVVSGLDSMVLGEEQIIGEVRDALEAAGSTGTIAFNDSGNVVSFGVDGAATGIVINPNNGGAQFTVEMDVQGGPGFTGITQYASDPTVFFREVDGRPLGSLLRFTIDTTGIITGIFSNEENLTLAQIALAEFPNPVGLLRAENGLFDTASSSGNPIIGRAGEQFTSSIISGSVETSNVDLVRQFTDMIVSQRGFQANARVVSTADQILEETMRLKR